MTYELDRLFNNFKLGANTAIENKIFLKKQIGWATHIKLLDISKTIAPIHINMRGIIENSTQKTSITSNLCNIEGKDISLRCNINTSINQHGFNLNKFEIFNIKNNDHMMISIIQSENNIKAKWEALITDYTYYSTNLTGNMYSKGQIILCNNATKEINFILNINNFFYRDFSIKMLKFEIKKSLVNLIISSNKDPITIRGKLENLSETHIKITLYKENFLKYILLKHPVNWFNQLTAVTTVNIIANLKEKIFVISTNYFSLGYTFSFEINSSHFNIYNFSKTQFNSNVKISSSEIDWISYLFPQWPISVNKGSFSIQLFMTGTLFNSQIKGEIICNKGRISIIPLNVNIDNIHTNILIENLSKIQIEINAKVEKSPLKIWGFFNFNNKKHRCQTTIYWERSFNN